MRVSRSGSGRSDRFVPEFFKLTTADWAYIERVGMDTVERYAADFVREKLSAAVPANDGGRLLCGTSGIQGDSCDCLLLPRLHGEMVERKARGAAFGCATGKGGQFDSRVDQAAGEGSRCRHGRVLLKTAYCIRCAGRGEWMKSEKIIMP